MRTSLFARTEHCQDLIVRIGGNAVQISSDTGSVKVKTIPFKRRIRIMYLPQIRCVQASVRAVEMSVLVIRDLDPDAGHCLAIVLQIQIVRTLYEGSILFHRPVAVQSPGNIS